VVQSPVSVLPHEAARQVEEWLGPGWSAQPLAGDASVRAYYRITTPDGQTYMLAWYPAEVRAQLARALDSFAALTPHVRVPAVLHHADAAVLQYDAGDRTIFDVLHEDREEGIRLYRDAIGLLVQFQRASCELNPAFTAEFFFGELQMAIEYYVEKLMGRSTNAALEPLLKVLCENIARHPYVLCHRDYHGQNVHVFNGSLYLIDYQDLRMGPDTYDVASLLRDRGVGRILGDALELELVDEYGRLTGADAAIRRRYFETLLQRSIKILGTFSKQPIVRGRMHYLEFIPATLESIRRSLAELPDYAPLAELIPLEFSLDRARDRARDLKET
jgi:aminoglycoside/choline kinase family phosphotransferase